jgi:hypothetical protein
MADDAKPLTLSELAGSGRHLIAECVDCGHNKKISPKALAVPGETAVGDVGKRMVCSCCGGKRILTRAESVRDARKGIER